VPKNIIICCDGTNNSFSTRASNVAQLVRYLDLSDASLQVTVYDQGIGTDVDRAREIEWVQSDAIRLGSLRVLRESARALSSVPILKKLSLVPGLAFGVGLRTNVRQSYQELATLYTEGDRVFLFGFSRGAFTVRVLAGLIHRCGLPTHAQAHDRQVFDDAWRNYTPMRPHPSITRMRECPIHFLGLWDTVKSYGALCPTMLPHLRHNPIVKHVRHALALDEKRALFAPTTWGRLDSDRKEGAAWSRLSDDDRARIDTQIIKEVWFRGCHSDVGGGESDTRTSRIALRWMLNEAASEQLRMNSVWPNLRDMDRDDEQPTITESDHAGWRLLARLPHKVINNSGAWPVLVDMQGNEGPRNPRDHLRNGGVTIHDSVRGAQVP
jgi:uncharacterized protein (DUF2235 family)